MPFIRPNWTTLDLDNRTNMSYDYAKNKEERPEPYTADVKGIFQNSEKNLVRINGSDRQHP